jgi:DNA-binding Lrp family transcriptional regulator
VSEFAEQLAAMPEVPEAYSVSGRYDLVAVVRVKINDEPAELVRSAWRKSKGSRRPIPCSPLRHIPSMIWNRCLPYSLFQQAT